MRLTARNNVVASLIAVSICASACRDTTAAPRGSDEIAPELVSSLGDFGGTWAVARGINDAGRIVGEASSDSGLRAFSWSSIGGMHDLGTLGGSSSSAAAVNRSSQIVGWSTSASEVPRAFLFMFGVGMRDLGTPAGGVAAAAMDISEDGTIVGRWITATGESRAFIYTATTGMRDLGSVADLVELRATSVNSRGDAVGFGLRSGSTTVHAAIWSREGVGRELDGFPAGAESVAWAINGDSTITGAFRRNSEPHRAFVWTASFGASDIGVLPGMDWSIAYDISDAGHVVGSSGRNGEQHGRAFVWTVDRGMRDLGALNQDATTSSGAAAVSRSGRPVGYSKRDAAFVPVQFPAVP